MGTYKVQSNGKAQSGLCLAHSRDGSGGSSNHCRSKWLPFSRKVRPQERWNNFRVCKGEKFR